MTAQLILTDAEYGQLTEVERTDYWRRRYYFAEEALEAEREKRLHLSRVVNRARTALDRA
jgi:hypothetical protein